MEFSFIMAIYDRCEPLNRRLLSGIATGLGGSEIDHDARDHTFARCIDKMVNSFRRGYGRRFSFSGAEWRSDGKSFYA